MNLVSKRGSSTPLSDPCRNDLGASVRSPADVPRLSAKRTCLQRTSCILGGRQCLVRHAPLLKSWCCCGAILKNYNAPLVSCGILNAFFDFLTLPMQVMPTCTASKAAVSACAALVHGTETQRRRLGAGGIRLGAEWTCHAKMARARAGLRTDKEWVAIYLGNCFLKFNFFWFLPPLYCLAFLLLCFSLLLCFFCLSAFFVSLLFLLFCCFASTLLFFCLSAFPLCCFSALLIFFFCISAFLLLLLLFFSASLFFFFCFFVFLLLLLICFSALLFFFFCFFVFLLLLLICFSVFLYFLLFCFYSCPFFLLLCFSALLLLCFFLFASLLLCFPLWFFVSMEFCLSALYCFLLFCFCCFLCFFCFLVVALLDYKCNCSYIKNSTSSTNNKSSKTKGTPRTTKATTRTRATKTATAAREEHN